MTQPRKSRSLLYALYANAALLLAVLVALLVRGGSVARAAPAPQPIAGNGNLYIMPAQLLNNVWGCYLLDVENQTLCTYTYNGNQLRLVAARNIRFDHALEDYNTSPPPDEVRRLVQTQQGRNQGAAPQPPPVPAPETQPALNK